MKRTSLHQCGACCYWSPMGRDTGLCRIRAPAVPSVNIETRPIAETGEAPTVEKVFATKRLAIWPATGAADWCGEYRLGNPLGGA